MTHRELYELKREKAKKKKDDGLALSKSEKVAYDEKWYFSIPLNIDIYDNIISMADDYGVMPYQIVEAWIMKGYISARGEDES